MSLRTSYTLLAPVYDAFIEPFFRAARDRSLEPLRRVVEPLDVLVDGAGTGLDFPLLPPQHRYTALDITPAMLRRARPRGGSLHMDYVIGDSQRLPFADDAFDYVVMHLILAVVPHPPAALREAARIVRPGGTVLVLDKFLRSGARAPLRRLINPLARRIATRTDVVLEDVLAQAPELATLENAGVAAGGWFRRLVLRKQGTIAPVASG